MDLLIIAIYLSQILLLYGVGRLFYRIINGEWDREYSYFYYYAVGWFFCISILCILLIIKLKIWDYFVQQQ
jgi:accessory gene regulator protein AgrB